MYIFIDIEACNKFSRASICNIAMIITNKKFEEIERFNLIINPETEFNLDLFDIGFDKAQLEDKPTFKDVYPLLKKYLNKNNIVFGHATKSDIIMLQASCERYNLEKFNFKFLCSQSFYSCIINSYSSSIGLKHLADIYNIEFTNHLAIEDAYATKEIFKAMLSKEKLSISDFMTKYLLNFGEVNSKVIKESLPSFIIANRFKKNLSKLEKRLKSPFRKKRNYYANLINQYIKDTEVHLNIADNEKIFKNEFICLNRTIERKNILETKRIIQIIHELGGHYTTELDKCTIYVTSDDINEDRRKKSFIKVRALHKKTANIMDLNEFMNIINRYSQEETKELVGVGA